MGTLVQSPEIADVQVSALQPIEKPVDTGGRLGTFLSNLLPVVGKVVDDHVEANKEHLFALGQNDKLNNMHREVSLIDSQNYTKGINYQLLVNGQLALDTKFQEAVDNMDTTNPDPEALFTMVKEHSAQSIDNIHMSSLPNDIKKSMYDAQIKSNAVNMTLVNKKLQQVTQDAEIKSRVNATAGLARTFRTAALTPEETITELTAWRTKFTTGVRTANPEMSYDAVLALADKSTEAALINALDTLHATGTAADVERIAWIGEFADQLIETSVEASTRVQTYAAKLEADVQSNADTFAQREFDNLVFEWSNDLTKVTQENFDKYQASVLSNPNITEEKRTQLLGDLTRLSTKLNKEVMEAQTVLDPANQDIPYYLSQGKTENDWVKDNMELLLQDYAGNPAAAGMALMQRAAQASYYSAAGVKAGSELVFGGLIGHASMSAQEAQHDPYAQQRQAQFAQVSELYRRYSKENGTKALDLLSGIDSKYVGAFSRAMKTGGTLEDVRRQFASPVSLADRDKFVDTAIVGLSADKLGIGRYLMGGIGGQGTNNIGDSLEESYIEKVQIVALQDKDYLIGNMSAASTDELLGLMQRNGNFLSSPKKYNSALLSTQAVKLMGALKVDGAPMPPQYIAKAMDEYREELAKTYDAKPANVIVMSTSDGKDFQFFVYKTEGTWGGLRKGTATLANGNNVGGNSGTFVGLNSLWDRAARAYRKDSTRQSSPEGVAEFQNSTRVGTATVRIHGTQTMKNVHVPAGYAYALGGNAQLGTDWLNHMGRMEGFVTKRTAARDANTKKLSWVHVHGITERTAGAALTAKLKDAAGNPQKLVDIQGEFLPKYYKDVNINGAISAVGIPKPTGAPYPKEHKYALMLLYDVGWHGGSGGLRGLKGDTGLIRAMNAPTLAQGQKYLRGLATYNRKAGNTSKRNVFMENALRAHFANKGRR